jgi:chaperonin GroEL
MAAKEVRFGSEARERMLRGIDILANAVKGIFLRKVRCVAAGRQGAASRPVNDGHSGLIVA